MRRWVVAPANSPSHLRTQKKGPAGHPFPQSLWSNASGQFKRACTRSPPLPIGIPVAARCGTLAMQATITQTVGPLTCLKNEGDPDEDRFNPPGAVDSPSREATYTPATASSKVNPWPPVSSGEVPCSFAPYIPSDDCSWLLVFVVILFGATQDDVASKPQMDGIPHGPAPSPRASL